MHFLSGSYTWHVTRESLFRDYLYTIIPLSVAWIPSKRSEPRYTPCSVTSVILSMFEAVVERFTTCHTGWLICLAGGARRAHLRISNMETQCLCDLRRLPILAGRCRSQGYDWHRWKVSLGAHCGTALAASFWCLLAPVPAFAICYLLHRDYLLYLGSTVDACATKPMWQSPCPWLGCTRAGSPPT